MKRHLDICINDRGFVKRPAQVSKISPTLRAQDHGNPPKVIEVIDDTYEYRSETKKGENMEDLDEIVVIDISKYRARKLTPTEYGRLQAFPVDDGWKQVVSDNQAYKQFGNAVTTTVVTAIGNSIRDFLDSHV